MASIPLRTYVTIKPGETRVFPKSTKIVGLIKDGNVNYTSQCDLPTATSMTCMDFLCPLDGHTMADSITNNIVEIRLDSETYVFQVSPPIVLGGSALDSRQTQVDKIADGIWKNVNVPNSIIKGLSVFACDWDKGDVLAVTLKVPDTVLRAYIKVADYNNTQEGPPTFLIEGVRKDCSVKRDMSSGARIAYQGNFPQ